MNYYLAIVHKDFDSAFGVTFPDLPGCFSAAERFEDVLPNAAEALSLWFEDQDEVAPSALEDIVKAHGDELAEGAFLVSVPYIRDGGRTVRVNLTMDQFTLDAIDTAAKEKGLTRSAFVTQAARSLIEGRA